MYYVEKGEEKKCGLVFTLPLWTKYICMKPNSLDQSKIGRCTMGPGHVHMNKLVHLRKCWLDDVHKQIMFAEKEYFSCRVWTWLWATAIFKANIDQNYRANRTTFEVHVMGTEYAWAQMQEQVSEYCQFLV
jgi:hypothetical protein